MPSAAGVVVHPGPAQDAVICLVALTGSPAPRKCCLLVGTLGSCKARYVWGCSGVGPSPTSQPGLFCQELVQALKKQYRITGVEGLLEVSSQPPYIQSTAWVLFLEW